MHGLRWSARLNFIFGFVGDFVPNGVGSEEESAKEWERLPRRRQDNYIKITQKA
jgi:hypothetical protein